MRNYIYEFFTRPSDEPLKPLKVSTKITFGGFEGTSLNIPELKKRLDKLNLLWMKLWSREQSGYYSVQSKRNMARIEKLTKTVVDEIVEIHRSIKTERPELLEKLFFFEPDVVCKDESK